MQLKDKVVLITGASSGIGEALSLRMAKEHCKLVLLARRKEKLTKILRLVQKDCKAIAVKCDVTKENEVKAAIKQIHKNFGEIDLAILNAGVSTEHGKEVLDDARKIIETNLFGAIHFIQELVPIFKEKKGGTIAGVSSLVDNRGYPSAGFYCASKAGLTRMLESLRIDLKRHNINVITIKPGFVETEMTMHKKTKPFVIKANEAAEIIVTGLKKDKKLIQFPKRAVVMIKIVGLTPKFLFDTIINGIIRRKKKETIQ